MTNIKKLRSLTQELEKCLEKLRVETNRQSRLQIFNQFKVIYSQIKQEL